jgi:outer membrane protein OmpA-like peptidoglycan-associated protein
MLVKTKIGVLALFVAVCFLTVFGVTYLNADPLKLSENPVVQIERLEYDLSKARKEQVNILAPTGFTKAEASLIDAKKKLDRGVKASKVLNKVEEGGAYLQQAEQMAKRSRSVLADVIKARELARAAGATSFGADYAKAEEQFLKLTKSVEEDKLKRARKNREKVSEAYRQLELRAIKEQTIGQARILIKQAEKEGARKRAPKTYAVAQKKLKEVDAFISKHRYQKLKMHTMANEALFQAGRLLQVTRQSKIVKSMRPEDITLWVEGMLHKTAKELSAPDMRDEPLDTQLDNIIGSIDSLQEDHQFMANKVKAQREEIKVTNEKYKARIAGMKQKIALLEGRTREEQAAREKLEAERRAAEQRLAAEREFQKLFSQVQGYFAPGEAEVYRQGTNLVIRLKAIRFPVGKDVIMPSNYSLLSKTQRAIRTFGEPDIVIEGHTDSTGSETMNDHLSQRRAESVREYFVANGTLSKDKIVAVGYGSKRPLASNQSVEGRAINRRIDLIITPPPQTGLTLSSRK